MTTEFWPFILLRQLASHKRPEFQYFHTFRFWLNRGFAFYRLTNLSLVKIELNLSYQDKFFFFSRGNVVSPCFVSVLVLGCARATRSRHGDEVPGI